MRKAIAIGIMAAAATAAACTGARSESGGPTVDRNYQVGNFSRIEVAGPYEVDVRTGSAPSVRAEGPERAIERMVVEVRGDTLRIHSDRERGIRIWSKDHPVRLSVTVPSLAGADIAGSGGIDVDRISGESFEGGVAGSGDLRLGSVEVRQLKFGIAGSGDIRAQNGRAASADFSIAGSGDIDAAGIVAEDAKVSIAGSGNVAANATRTGKVSILGSGDVRVTGGAKCDVSKTGSGNVVCS